jgi:hypothetical protein
LVPVPERRCRNPGRAVVVDHHVAVLPRDLREPLHDHSVRAYGRGEHVVVRDPVEEALDYVARHGADRTA